MAEAAAGVVAVAAATVVAALAAVAVVVVARAAIVGVVGVVADVAVRVGVGVAAVAQKAAMVERERERKQRAVDLQSVQRQLEAEAPRLPQNNQQCRRNVILKQGKRCGTVTSRQEWLAHEGLSVYWCVRSGAGRKKKENRRRRRLARNAQLKCAVYERVQQTPGLLEKI